MERNTKIKQELILLATKLLIILGVLFILLFIIFGVTPVIDRAMEPAMKDGDLVLYYRLNKTYAQNDLVVVNIGGQTQVRRIIAGPGDIVDIKEEGGLVVNGALQQEDNIYFDTYRYEEGIDFPVSLGSNEYFILGDNRENSIDSRIYGPVTKDSIRGSVFTLIRRMSF